MVISRGKGHSAVAGAAYRAGQNLKGIGQGEDGADKLFRYSNRASVVRETFFMTPDGDAPDYLILDDGPSPNVMRQARADLWNDVDGMEKGKTARLGRELQLGFAHELSHDEQRELVKEFVRERFTDGGKAVVRVGKRDVEVDLNFVVDVAIHNYGRAVPAIGASDDQRDKLRRLAADGYTFVERDEAEGMEAPHIRIERTRDGDVTGYRVYQPHAHVRITPRNFVDGQWEENKFASRALNGHDVCKDWRYDWPKLQNQYLERKGSDVRVTCTSEFEDQYPDIRFLGTERDHQAHHRTERAEQMPDEAREKHQEAEDVAARDAEFRETVNEALARTAADERADPATRDDAREARRLATWWRNMSERFEGWRHDFTEKAQEWRARFEAQDWRLKSMLGWNRNSEPPEQVPETTPEPQVQDVQMQPVEPTQDPQTPEPDPPEPDR
jgi:hypothetical protein